MKSVTRERFFHVASEKEILEGKTTDVYFENTLKVIQAKGLDKHVVAEVILKNFPYAYQWGLLAGVEECIRLFEGKAGVTFRALPEGSVFFPYQPVVELSGPYSSFCLFETALLGLLCQSSGIATKAARCRIIGEGKMLLSFGARRMHPALSPLLERSAMIAGFDGYSSVAANYLLESGAKGTMPHALILLAGETLEAVKLFDEVVDKRFPRIALIDTLQDEKFEAIRVADALGKKLVGIRLDTPLSRRGNLRSILKEIRWELALRGQGHVQIFLSGGIGEKEIAEVWDLVDGFGLGTSISSAPVLDLALDIVEVEGKPFAKRGKESGAKEVFHCREHLDMMAWQPRKVKEIPSCPACKKSMTKSFVTYIENGEKIAEPLSVKEIRSLVAKRLPYFKESL